MRYLEIPGLKSEGDLPPEERDLKDDIPLKKSGAIGSNTDDADDYGDTAFLLTNSKPFEVEHSTEPGQELFKRTGTIWTATAHIITGVIGAGVLSLAWSTAQLGWIAGPLSMIFFALITLISTLLLCECYMTPDPECGPIRHGSLTGAVKFFLGEKRHRICAIFVLESLYGTAVAYTITVVESASAIKKSNCYHIEGHNSSCGHVNANMLMLIFGAVQILVSQIPDFHNMAWLSIVAAVMSFTYAFIGFALGLAKTIGNGMVMGSISGVPAGSGAEKLWLVFQGIADIAFAYPYSVILLEIQDTLKSPPSETQSMKKASSISIATTTIFYLCCGCFGYAAFGDKTPGNLLTGFGFYEPYWLVDFANACIILHLVGGYQLVCQVIFALVEKWFAAEYPNSALRKNLDLKLPMFPKFELNMFRFVFRTAFVVTATGNAMLFPYFNQVLGVLGALNFWSLGIYFPVEMYIVQKKIGAWTRKWVLLEVFSLVCMVISVVALIGSVEGLIRAKLS
ncbi:probable amino acid permease 7 [Coffea eugenioides]|uniref:Probable amino acid permease 7 n=1 Tax=Coffea arabica TaxID=13443 RepID=A0A6P6URQ2_COFAR|nr:probable amino acid permease 7 [Coffea arabica]XP_027149534.1 probable amino acid permease 7 [Coffea eugenioides]